ncbi:Short-chain dehydrogenase/reductase family protein [Mycena venus]|uniref:Short-chain dehydrogenase/reductase family protein n=1 Tax=Mycena venus TaxID=2733690 RepID=A0A8H6XL63_9AGAR|nr:Short-chain dehydrogenase/reductase family protein [Mycena venus]
MLENRSPVFLITGCSTGLGREMALAALGKGFRVIATARRVETLSALRDLGAKIMTLDVTSSTTVLKEFAATAIAIYGQVDYLVNNAGFVQGGAVEEVSVEEALAQFNTNFFGLVNTTKAFLPYFRKRRTGTLVNISSQGSCLGTPGGGFYCASKAAVDTISDAWAHELAEFGVRSISVQPGAFRTEVLQSINARFAEKSIEGYTVAHGVIASLSKLAGKEPGDTAKAARNIIEVVTRPDLPLRFVIGNDAVANVRAFYQARLIEIEATKEWGTDTDYPA